MRVTIFNFVNSYEAKTIKKEKCITNLSAPRLVKPMAFYYGCGLVFSALGY